MSQTLPGHCGKRWKNGSISAGYGMPIVRKKLTI
jgi:hypothetical protein